MNTDGIPTRKVLLSIRHAVGGIRTYLKYTLGCFDPKRYEFRIVMVAGAETPALRDDLQAFQPEIIQVPSQRAVPRLAAAVYSVCRAWRPDVLHSHGLTAGVASVPGALLTRTPHVLTSHGVLTPRDFHGVQGKLRHAVLTAVLNQVDILHSVSASAEDNIRAFLPGLSVDRLQMVRNGVPPPPTNNEVEGRRWRSEVGRPGETLFGFFGRFMPEKGFDSLIDAVSRLDAAGIRNFRVLAVSDGSFIREYEAMIAGKGIGGRFSFLGFIPNARHVMPWLDAVVVPSLLEACPLVAMEALSAGTPLISTAAYGLADVTAGSPAILVETGNADALARAMAALMEDIKNRTAAARAFQATAIQRFDIAASAAGLEKLFDRVLVR